MLGLLAIRREVRRDEVVDLLWRGVGEDKARNAFRQALHRLRAAVGEDVLPQDRERLRLVSTDTLGIDIHRFESAIAAGRLAEAADICVGDFLENASLGEPPFDMWAEQERTRLRTRLARVLTDAVAQSSAEGRWTDAIAQTRRLLVVAPFEASSANLAATTLIAAGRRQEARDLLKQFASSLESELGLPLPSDLNALLTRLERQPGPTAATQAVGAPTRSAGIALPFAGRESELSQLVTLCRATEEESGGFALVKGDAGIGKSRLLTELIAHVKSLGRITALHGREHVAGIQLPYAVFAEALRPLARAPGVAGASRHLLAEAARLIPELRDEMDLPAVTDVEDDAGRLRFFEGIAALVDAAAFERPIALIVDDVHLAGPSTLELLMYLCARLARSAVTFVVTVRPSETPASMLARLESVAKPDSQTHPGRSLSISVGAIESNAARDAVTRATSAMHVDDATVSQIVARAEGVPARLSDLVRRVARGERIPTSPISLRDVIVDRIARLTSSQRRLLFVIALVDRPSSRDLAGAAAHLPATAVDDSVDALRAEDLVTVRSDGLMEIGAETSRAALELAGPSTRAFLSGWIADELVARSGAAGEVARFFVAAGQAKPAFEKSRLAAFDALAVGAVPEATHHLQVARGFAPSADDAAAIESILNALGAGLRQIPTVKAGSSRAQSEPTGVAAPSRVSEPAGRFAALFPNWRLLLGAAVATLTISSIVLADRSRSGSIVAALPASDTLVVAEDAAHRILRTVIGDMSKGFTISSRRTAPPSSPAWIDSLPRHWTNPMTAPGRQRVVLERVSESGSDLLIVSADRRDTTPVAVDVGDAHALGWSPDGRWLLASLAPSRGSFDAQLIAFHDIGTAVDRRAIDASPGRSVVEAAWSPDGTRIAWVARVGVERQLEVFVSDADGRNSRNISRHPADDQHIAWSPDGKLLAFTSARDGNAELYALSFLESRLWRLTFDAAQDDAAEFSPDSRLVAFESTRGGAAAVYVMPALGGDARRIQSPATISVVRWIGRPSRYIDRVLVEPPQRVRRGDTASMHLVAFDQFDEPVDVAGAQWRVLDSLPLRQVDDTASERIRFVARGDGIARIAGSVGGWRSDTALVALGNGTIRILHGNQMGFWRLLGAPRPRLTGQGIALLSDREWESGVLSRNSVPLLPGLVLQAVLRLPISDARDAAATATVSLVAPEDSSALDEDAPQFLRYASLGWNAESGRLVYAVGREVFSEPAASVSAVGGSALSIQLRIESDSTLSFRIGGQQRWRSSLRVLSSRQRLRGQVWISSRATGAGAGLSNLSIRLEPAAPNSR